MDEKKPYRVHPNVSPTGRHLWGQCFSNPKNRKTNQEGNTKQGQSNLNQGKRTTSNQGNHSHFLDANSNSNNATGTTNQEQHCFDLEATKAEGNGNDLEADIYSNGWERARNRQYN